MHSCSGTGLEHGTRGTSAEGEHLVDLVVHGSLNASTLKEYSSKWKTWEEERAKANLGPWLYEADGEDSAVRKLTVFMASGCLCYNNKSATAREYLAAIKYFHKMHEGWELPTSHFRVKALEKSIDRVHARSGVKYYVWNPLGTHTPSGKRNCTDGDV